MVKLRDLTIVFVLMASPVVLAATPAPSAAVCAACGADARKLCGAVIGDSEARHKCMVEHRAQLSEACKAAIAQGRQSDAPAAAAPAEPTSGAK
jgi:hypothetical protein